MIDLAQSIITIVGVASKLVNKQEVTRKREEKIMEFRGMSPERQQQETYNQYLRNTRR